LRASGRHIVYSINPNSSGDPGAGLEYDWSHIADITRDAVDLVPAWGDTALWQEGLAGVAQAFTEAGSLAPRSNPTHVNDPDMLVVGIGWEQFAVGHPTMALGAPRPDLTDTEQRAHFSLWAMLAAPLLAGNDIRDMTDQTRDILTNRDVIAVDQDPLMVQGQPLSSDPRVVIKRLTGGAVAVALFNQSADPQTVRTSLAAIGLTGNACATVRDLWQHTDSTSTGTVERQVPGHGVAMLRVTPECG
jgi:alpha-galactosidase